MRRKASALRCSRRIRGARAPELDKPDTLQWMGRFLGRVHAVGAITFLSRAPDAGHRQFRRGFDAYLLEHRSWPDDLSPACKAWPNGAGRRAPLLPRALAQSHRSARMATATPATCQDGRRAAFRGFRRLPHRAGRVDLWMLLSGERADMTQQFGDVLAGW
ncbi:MAG: hypothetical protein M5R42_04355 [Rhodocyclaceae bacterium]|nr:hypothetical protein [Rhodocyclaceae bacterium]